MMKKTIAALILVTGLTMALEAQEAKPAPGGKGKRIQQKDLSLDEKSEHRAVKVQKELGLSDEQKAKWEAAAKERMLANQPIREKLAGSTTPQERKALRQQAKANNDKFDTAVNAFLTPEQKSKFEAIKKDRMEKRRAGKKPGEPKEDSIQDLIND